MNKKSVTMGWSYILLLALGLLALLIIILAIVRPGKTNLLAVFGLL
jgi:hypothetical protein